MGDMQKKGKGVKMPYIKKKEYEELLNLFYEGIELTQEALENYMDYMATDLNLPEFDTKLFKANQEMLIKLRLKLKEIKELIEKKKRE